MRRGCASTGSSTKRRHCPAHARAAASTSRLNAPSGFMSRPSTRTSKSVLALHFCIIMAARCSLFSTLHRYRYHCPVCRKGARPASRDQGLGHSGGPADECHQTNNTGAPAAGHRGLQRLRWSGGARRHVGVQRMQPAAALGVRRVACIPDRAPPKPAVHHLPRPLPDGAGRSGVGADHGSSLRRATRRDGVVGATRRLVPALVRRAGNGRRPCVAVATGTSGGCRGQCADDGTRATHRGLCDIPACGAAFTKAARCPVATLWDSEVWDALPMALSRVVNRLLHVLSGSRAERAGGPDGDRRDYRWSGSRGCARPAASVGSRVRVRSLRFGRATRRRLDMAAVWCATLVRQHSCLGHLAPLDMTALPLNSSHARDIARMGRLPVHVS
eukprot:m.154645 g.154645  ORF g.154645 m.154645 type:complete len:387 (+) comp11719_c0_seq2:4356-5516(+)